MAFKIQNRRTLTGFMTYNSVHCHKSVGNPKVDFLNLTQFSNITVPTKVSLVAVRAIDRNSLGLIEVTDLVRCYGSRQISAAGGRTVVHSVPLFSGKRLNTSLTADDDNGPLGLSETRASVAALQVAAGSCRLGREVDRAQ